MKSLEDRAQELACEFFAQPEFTSDNLAHVLTAALREVRADSLKVAERIVLDLETPWNRSEVAKRISALEEPR